MFVCSTHAASARGCLLGGALGDALGAPVKHLRLTEIRRRFRSDGLQAFAFAFGRLGAITADTQMTLFTAEGVMRAHMRLATGVSASRPRWSPMPTSGGC